MNELPDLSDVPAVPLEAEFSVLAFEWTWCPHPYMLSQDHTNYAAKHSLAITEDAIREAEKEGVMCALCQSVKRGPVPFDEHRKVIGMVIRPEVPDKVPNFLGGFKEWLNQNEYVIRNELKVEMLLFAKYEQRIVRRP